VSMTEWFKPPITPVRVGAYELCIYDAGWTYEWKAWWDGYVWRDTQDGWALTDQNQTWRGQTK
jgi:hypothetical protein